MEAVLEPLPAIAPHSISVELARQVLANAKKRPRGRAFTPEQARAAALKSNEAQKARKLNPPPPEPLHPPSAVLPTITPHLTEDERKTLVGAYKELCEASRKQLLTLTDPKDRHQEASTLAKLEACYWRYAGIPGEGTLKPQSTKPDKRRPMSITPE